MGTGSNVLKNENNYLTFSNIWYKKMKKAPLPKQYISILLLYNVYSGQNGQVFNYLKFVANYQKTLYLQVLCTLYIYQSTVKAV